MNCGAVSNKYYEHVSVFLQQLSGMQITTFLRCIMFSPAGCLMIFFWGGEEREEEEVTEHTMCV